MTTLQGPAQRPRSPGWGMISQSGGGAEVGLQLSPERLQFSARKEKREAWVAASHLQGMERASGRAGL